MENRSSSPAAAATNQAHPGLHPSTSRASNEASTRAPSPEAVSLLSQNSNTFDNQPVSPSSISPTPPYQFGETPTPTGVSFNSPSPVREKKNQQQISENPINIDTIRRTTTLSQKYQHYVTGKWTWEIVSCLLAIGTLVGLVVTLSRYDGHPQPSLPYKVSINTLVSIFATIIKGLLLISVAAGLGQLKWLWYEKPRPLQNFSQFDQATQGPLGATKLLWTLRLKHLASLGAFIMVIAIAFDPFTQAVLHLYSCNVILPSRNGTIPRSNNYTGSGAHSGAGEATLNQPMQNAIYTGIYNSANASQTQFECSSGNCTFPTYEGISYQSVGVCSQCVDISEKMSINCTDSCEVSLGTFPKTTTLEGYQYFVMYPLLYAQRVNASLPPASAIAHFSIITRNSTYEEENSEDTTSLNSYFAVECALYTCVKSYNASITGGTLDETIVDISLNLDSYNPVNGSYTVPSPCVVNGSVISGTDLQGDHPNDDAWKQMTLNGSSTYVRKECAYGISGGTEEAFNSFFTDLFNGDIEGIDSVGVTASPSWLSVLYDSGNSTVASINEIIADIATSMTNFMRQNGQAGNSDPGYGVMYGTETCVNVQWGWIAFPATVVALTALFLLITILKSRRHPGQLVWKSEILPVLYHGLDPSLRDRAGLAANAEDMEQSSSTMTVHLKRTATGWRFVDSQENPEVVDITENRGFRGV